MRTTPKVLNTIVGWINTILDTEQDKDNYYIGKSNERMRLLKHVGDGCDDISPALPPGQLADWMRGFLHGAVAGKNLHKRKG